MCVLHTATFVQRKWRPHRPLPSYSYLLIVKNLQRVFIKTWKASGPKPNIQLNFLKNYLLVQKTWKSVTKNKHFAKEKFGCHQIWSQTVGGFKSPLATKKTLQFTKIRSLYSSCLAGEFRLPLQLCFAIWLTILRKFYSFWFSSNAKLHWECKDSEKRLSSLFRLLDAKSADLEKSNGN